MPEWWRQGPMRLVQTNLREIDVAIDPRRFVDALREFSANVLLFSAGGIVANYPTDLPYHYRNPRLRNDFLGEVLELAHAAGIRLIARFDFSKVNEVIAGRHEQWHYKSVAGTSVTYNGQTHVCINGEYQQRYSLEILAEVARRYPVDGVFINMHGYQVRDYSRTYHGICQCANCLRRFAEHSGFDRLPVREDDPTDPVFAAYQAFTAATVAELFERRAAAVKAIRPQIATCNYTPAGTDIFRLESGTHLVDGQPDFVYGASHHVKLVTNSWPGMAVSNAAVHFVDYPMRYSAVSPHLTARRLAQDAVHGGWLDYYVMGTLSGQEDRRCFAAVRDLFAYHARNQRYYAGMVPLADVCLVEPYRSTRYGSMREYLGLYQILAERHVLFDVLRDEVLDDPGTAARLAGYQAIVLPDARVLGGTARAALDSYVRAGGTLLATGATASHDPAGQPLPGPALASLGIAHIAARHVRTQGGYLAISPMDRQSLAGFDDLDLVYLYGELLDCVPGPDAEAFLRYVPAHMFGPPEKCYYTEVSDTPGLIRARYGSGTTATLPWTVGAHYHEYSHDGHARLVLAALRDLLGYLPSLRTDAPPVVELAAHHHPESGTDLVHAVNLTGALGTAWHEPVPLPGIAVRLRTGRVARVARALRAGVAVPVSTQDGLVTVTLPDLGLFETVVIEYQEDQDG